MGDSSILSRFFNPLVLHFQKLALELKCPLCLDLLSQPVLLPCNHMFCNFCVPDSVQFGMGCPVCKHAFKDKDIREAPYMESIVGIYKSMNGTLIASLSSSSDNRKPSDRSFVSANRKIDGQLGQFPRETPQARNSINGQSKFSQAHNRDCASPRGWAKEGADLIEKVGKDATLRSNGQEEPGTCAVVNVGVNGGTKGQKDVARDELNLNEDVHLSSDGNSFYSDTEAVGKTSDPCSTVKRAEKHITKRLVDSSSDKDEGNRIKRQKKSNFGPAESSLEMNPIVQQDTNSGNLVGSNCSVGMEEREPLSVSQPNTPSDISDVKKSPCAFCNSSDLTDGTGPMLYYADGKEVSASLACSDIIPVHRKCIEWTPQVYYEGENIRNLESELARAAKLKCSHCGMKGAGLGCFFKSCRRSYHVPCAFEIEGCRWDSDDFLLLCPMHKHKKFPSKKSKYQNRASGEKYPATTSKKVAKQLCSWEVSAPGPKEWVFCGSALSDNEKYHMAELARICGATVTKSWKPTVTHVIAATDEKGACRRTLKVLMAILKGRWVLTMDWVKKCMEEKQRVDEEPYEVIQDNHGCANGPRTGRLMALHNGPKLFAGLNFYFNGFFLPPYKSDLVKLVLTAGGNIIEEMEQLMGLRDCAQSTLIVFNGDAPQACIPGEVSSVVLQRLEDAQKMADGIGARVVRHTWILESISACQVQPYSLR